MTNLDKNCFSGTADELANDQAKAWNNNPDNIVEAMQSSRSYQYDGRTMEDVMSVKDN